MIKDLGIELCDNLVSTSSFEVLGVTVHDYNQATLKLAYVKNLIDVSVEGKSGTIPTRLCFEAEIKIQNPSFASTELITHTILRIPNFKSDPEAFYRDPKEFAPVRIATFIEQQITKLSFEEQVMQVFNPLD